MPENVSFAEVFQIFISVFSLLSVVFAIYFGFKNIKEKDEGSHLKEVEQLSKLNGNILQIKDHIGSIKTDLDDIKIDIKEMRDEQKVYSEKMAVVEHKTNEAALKIEMLQEICKKLEIKVGILEQNKKEQ